MRRLVAIHQPNFLPWLGYFDKLARADVFVILDSVQFPRTSRGTWMNRVKLLVSGSPSWVTVPVVRAKTGVQQVREVEIDPTQRWREKLLRTIEVNYRRAACFDESFPLVQEVLAEPARNLADFNEAGVRRLAEALGLDTRRLVRSSALPPQSSGTDLLIDLTLAAGGTTYLSGGGADGYQQDDRFAERGVELLYQDFVQPTYPQIVAEPVRGLSVVDALLSCGTTGVRRLLGLEFASA